MQYRQLGNSDLKISEIALGSWMTFGGGVEAKRSEACVRRALELGINFIDTANVYSGGEAERFLGRVLAPVDRKSYFIATKLYFPMSPNDHGLSRAQIEKQLDASLERLSQPSSHRCSSDCQRRRATALIAGISSTQSPSVGFGSPRSAPSMIASSSGSSGRAFAP